VAAQGRHLATWVNGFQETDWTDNRPEKDNARNGCRLAAGPISLQGHDPTTDLSFRNFRIQELAPEGKKRRERPGLSGGGRAGLGPAASPPSQLVRVRAKASTTAP
jgi:hypothetical protein